MEGSTLLTVLLALASAACYAGALIVTQFALRYTAPVWGAAVSVAFTSLLWWAAAPLFIDWSELRPGALAVFAAVGLFYPAVVMMLTYESNRVLGPTLTGTASSTTPVFAVASAMLVLGERPAVAVIAGGAIIVAGLAILSMKAPMRFAPGWRLLIPLTGAGLRGIAQSLIKLGLLISPSPFTAALVSYSASTAVVWGAAAGISPERITGLAKRGVLWFMAVAALNGTAVLLMCHALHHGSVGIVSPIVATYPLFTIGLSAAFLRREKLGATGVLGVILTVAGVITVTTG